MLNYIKILALSFLFFAPTAFAGDQMPSDFKLKGLYGGKMSAADLKGKKVVLQFWASWCEGCGDAMGKVNRAVRKSDVVFLPVSLDEDIKSARGYFKHQQKRVKPLRKKSFLDAEATLAEGLGVESLPAMVMVDESGKVIMRLSGHPAAKDIRKIKKLSK